MQKETFYNLEFIPNKLVYVYEIGKTEIKFLAFFNCAKYGFKAHKHTLDIKSKKEFKKIKTCFNPNEQIKEMIKVELFN